VFPVCATPYDIHRQENTYDRRRNCKATQQTISLATCRLYIQNYDETWNQIDTRTINLNVAKIQEEIVADAVYFRTNLYVLGLGSVIYDDLQWYVG
jgi:hypothetical protein